MVTYLVLKYVIAYVTKIQKSPNKKVVLLSGRHMFAVYSRYGKCDTHVFLIGVL
jgi:hypothetical protein